MVKCESKDCTARAVAIAFWPGRVIKFCEACEKRARTVADAMGFELTTTQLPAHMGIVEDERG